MVNLKQSQRKFLFASFFSFTTTLALFTGYMDATNYVWTIGTILSLYGAANVGEKFVDKKYGEDNA